jgi:hypothetical protein
VNRKKILHYRQLYINRPDPIVFLPAEVDTTGRLYDDLSRLLFLHTHREVSALDNDIPEKSDQFPFLRVVCYVNIKGSLGLILVKTSTIRISIPLDLSSLYHCRVSFVRDILFLVFMMKKYVNTILITITGPLIQG